MHLDSDKRDLRIALEEARITKKQILVTMKCLRKKKICSLKSLQALTLGEIADLRLPTEAETALGIWTKANRAQNVAGFGLRFTEPNSMNESQKNDTKVTKKTKTKGAIEKISQGHDLQRDTSKRKDQLFFKELSDISEMSKVKIEVNRMPVLLLWSIVACERLSYTQEEALTISYAYTNIISEKKKKSLGIHKDCFFQTESNNGGKMDTVIQFMGENIPCSRTGGRLRAVGVNSCDAPFSLLRRKFGETLDIFYSAMKMLSSNVDKASFIRGGGDSWRLYQSFRPKVSAGETGLGEVSDLNCGDILRLITK